MVSNSPTLKDVFTGFAGGRTELANKEFAKLNKDCGLLDKVWTNTDVDMAFVKHKAKTSKVLTFDQFCAALEDISKKKKVGVDDIKAKIVSAGGPQFTGTKADYVKFHDDKTTYTGVYAKGGPSTVDQGKGVISDISQTCNRQASDARGVLK